MKIFKLLVSIAIVFYLQIFSGCASIGRPGGGPEDKEPPAIIVVDPPPGTTSIDSETDFEIVFSERIDQNTFKESLFISPKPKKEVKVSYRGDKVKLKFPEDLPENQTVVITIGSGVEDLRRNSMEESVTIAVSTGDRIDQGEITGFVYDGQGSSKNMIVAAWKLQADSLVDITETIPPFLTQTSNNGGYKIEYLPMGHYRVVTYEDSDRDRLYLPGRDKLGLPWRDIFLKQDSAARMDFYTVKRDTGAIHPLYATAPDQNHIVFKYNRKPNLDISKYPALITVRDSTSILRIQNSWFDPTDSSRIVSNTSMQKPESEYIVTFLADTVQLNFTGESRPDTLGPKIVYSSPKSGSREASNPPEGWVAFNDAINQSFPDSAFLLTTSDSVEVRISAFFKPPNIINWKALDTLEAGKKCNLEIKTLYIKDIQNNASPDSIWENSFNLLDPAKTGEISGKIINTAAENIIVKAASISGFGRNEDYSGKINYDREYLIRYLPPGKYLVWAFADVDKDSRYDPGFWQPFIFAERFLFMQDTIEVKTRWETSGIDVVF